jgi:hypothetical protein
VSRYTIGRRLREAEQEMARAQLRRDRLTDSLSTTVDHTELARIGSELAVAQAALDDIEERWLDLVEQSTP